MTTPEQALPPALAALQSAVEADWERASLHQALLGLAFELGEQTRVAAWYRRQTHDPVRAALARSQLSRLATLALLELDAKRAQREQKKPGKALNYTILALLALATVTLLAQL